MDTLPQHQIRYDRQIRLWGDDGQKSIQQANVCIFGSSALAAEILKSLVLAGIGSFHIIDKALVEDSDLGQNFFLEQNDIGKYRGECLVRHLIELNPTVHGQHTPIAFTEFSSQDFRSLLYCRSIIATNMSIREAIQLDQFLFEHNLPFVYARVHGMLGYLRLSFREHHIWNTHKENEAYDLRLDKPFPELLKLANETDLSTMKHEQHSHTPYVLLYFKAIDEWRKRHKLDMTMDGMETDGSSNEPFPDVYKHRKELEKILMEMRQPDDKGLLDEENFLEAKQNLLKGLKPTKIPDNVLAVFEDPKTTPNLMDNEHEIVSSHWLEPFWVLCAALRAFVDKHGHMPLSGQLPDMTSDSERYAQLLGLYRRKSSEDAEELRALATEVLSQRTSILSSRTLSSSSSAYIPSAVANGSDESFVDDSHDEDTTTDEDEDGSRMSTTDAIELQQQERNSVSMDSEGRGSNKEASAVSSLMQVGDSPCSNGLREISTYQSFVKAASKIAVQYGASLSSEFCASKNVTSILSRMERAELENRPPEIPQVDPLCWYVLLRALDKFCEINRRIPGEVDSESALEKDVQDLQTHVVQLFADTKDDMLISRQAELVPLEAVREMCRIGASEPHVVASILGGSVAQEVIKLCTHQYTLVNNTLIFDGHTQQATGFRLETQ